MNVSMIFQLETHEKEEVTVRRKTVVKTDFYVKQLKDGMQMMIDFLDKGPAHEVSIFSYDNFMFI